MLQESNPPAEPAGANDPDDDLPDETTPNYPEPPSNPPVCNAPGSTQAGADPSLVQNLGAVYCKSWPISKSGSPYPAQPTSALRSKLTDVDLSPKIANAKLSVSFDFEPIAPILEGCYMGCTDMIPQLIKPVSSIPTLSPASRSSVSHVEISR